MTIQIPREQTEFVTGELMLNFIQCFAGEQQPSMTPGSYAFKIEGVVDPSAMREPAFQPMLQALSVVAQAYGGKDWQSLIFGRRGKIKLLAEGDKNETDRTPEKYPYAINKYILPFSAVWNPQTLGFKDPSFDLSQPANREKFERALNAKAPGVYRYANPHDPMDVEKVQRMSSERVSRGLPAIADADIYKTLIPLESHEVWSGCYGRISGRVYWAKNTKPAGLGLALTHVLMTRTGERVGGGGGPSADSVFGAFAPTADLAPPAPPMGMILPPQQPPAAPGWGSLI